MYIPTSQDLAILKSVFDLAKQVFHYFSNPSASARPQKSRASAVLSTLDEWESLLISVQPKLAEKLLKLRNLPYLERSRQLEQLAIHYSDFLAPGPPLVPSFFHTKVTSAPGGGTVIRF